MKNHRSDKDLKKLNWKAIIPYILIPLLFIGVMYVYMDSEADKDFKYYEVIEFFDNEQIAELDFNMNSGVLKFKLKGDDSLVNVLILKDEDIVISTFGGKIIRIKSTDVNISSRVAQGLVGVRLEDGDYITSLTAIRDETDDIAIFTSKGFGKRVPLSDVSSQKRGGKGLVGYKPDDTRGGLIALAMVNDNDSLLLVGENNSICISAAQIPVTSRAAKGNILIKGNSIVSVSKV